MAAGGAAAALALAAVAAAAHAWPGALAPSAPTPGPSAFPTNFPISDPQHAQAGRVGSPVEVGTQSGTRVRVTVVGTNLQDRGTAQVPLGDPLAYRFIDVRVRVTNLSPYPLLYSEADVWLSDSTGHPYVSRRSPLEPQVPEDTQSLPSGETVEGYVGFEVPRSASGLEAWIIVGSRAVRVPLR